MKKILLNKGMMMFLWCLLSISAFGVVAKAESGLKAPNPVKIVKYSDTELRLSWKKIKGTDGYIVYKYNKTSKKYKKCKIIKDKNTVQFIDKVGKNKSAKYKVAAYKKAKNKKIPGQMSYYVEAKAYSQGTKTVNTGKVEARIEGKIYEKVGGDFFAYHETVKLLAKVKPSKSSKRLGRKPLSKKVRWFSTNPRIATIDENGEVKTQTKAGQCFIYARAHNGKQSNKICINVENYAKPGENAINIHEAWENQSRYGAVVEMFEFYYEATTDIAEYFYIKRPTGQQRFRCWMGADGKVKMSSEDYLTGRIKKEVHDFVDKIPFNIEVYATPDYVKFTEYLGDGEERTTGAMVTFTYDRKKKDPTSYDQKYEIAENWVYGYPMKK